MIAPNIIITMAGEGKRFRKVGFNEPKFMIYAKEHTLFYWSMMSLKNFIDLKCSFTFISRKDDKAKLFIKSECQLLNINLFNIIELDNLTDGQATTALLAWDYVSDKSLPLLIYNIDTYVEPEYLPVTAINGHGWIPCFPGEGEKWSFAKLGLNNKIVDIREKKRISPHATIGLYWFKSFELYRDLYYSYFNENKNIEAGEKYIAPMYNLMINKGLDVYMHNVPLHGVHPLGTPEDLVDFIND